MNLQNYGICFERNLWGWRGWANEGCIPWWEVKKALQTTILLKLVCYDVRINNTS